MAGHRVLRLDFILWILGFVHLPQQGKVVDQVEKLLTGHSRRQAGRHGAAQFPDRGHLILLKGNEGFLGKLAKDDLLLPAISFVTLHDFPRLGGDLEKGIAFFYLPSRPEQFLHNTIVVEGGADETKVWPNHAPCGPDAVTAHAGVGQHFATVGIPFLPRHVDQFMEIPMIWRKSFTTCVGKVGKKLVQIIAEATR